MGASGAATSMSAQKPADFESTGSPAAVFAGISENTSISYIGPAPGPIVGALDVDDSTYNRQFGNCSGLSGTGTAVFYDTVTITNNFGASANFVVSTSAVGDTSSCVPAPGDTFLTAYIPSFNPASSGTNCVVSDDDSGIGLCSAIAFPIPAGATAVVVVTSFANGDTTPYQVNFDGTDNFPAVPFAGPTWLIVLGLALSALGAWVMVRRRYELADR